MLNISFSKSFIRQTAAVALLVALSVPLSGCDLTKNHLKADRSSDMEIQDYRDALAQREPDVSDRDSNSNIPELKPYMATPSDKLKPMPLVSVAVNQTVPLRDVLYELAQQADYDLELDPRIRGSIIFTARNRPFDEVVDRIATTAGLRYKMGNESVKIELDTPYQEVYKINYLSLVRKNSGAIANNVAVVSGEGADTGSNFKSETTSEIDFWKELETNLEQIINANRDAQTLRTERDPQITAVAQSPAPVEPVVLTSDGEIAEGGPNVQVQAPQAVLQIQPLPIDENETRNDPNKEDPFASRYSINRQAGLISVFANEHLQKIVSRYLEKLEKSVSSQVLIEAKVLEVGLTDEFAAGIDWGQINGSEFNMGVRSTVVDPTTGIPSVIPAFTPESNPGIGMIASYLGNDLTVTARALSRFGTVRALASPRVTVLNNQAAVLNVARNQVWFEIDADLQQGNALGQPPILSLDTTIRNVPEGVLINVQPSIDLNKQSVTMAVRPTVTRIVEYIPDPAASIFNVTSGVPVVNIQEFDSVLTLNNGQALVLGGLIQDRTDSQQNAVPVLGEVPLIGGLFRNQGDKISKTELVVLMKATIIGGGNNIHNTDKDLYRTFSQDRRPWEL